METRRLRLCGRDVEAFHAGEGVVVAEGVAVGYVLLPAACLPGHGIALVSFHGKLSDGDGV